jgi:hypothetical protein
MDAQLRVSDAGGITAIVAAMMAHPSDASIQENGCAALDTLSACVRRTETHYLVVWPNQPCIAMHCTACRVAHAACATWWQTAG